MSENGLILSDLRRFCPIFAGVLQTLENKAPILFNFAPILSDLGFLQIRPNQTKSARPHWGDPFWEFPKNRRSTLRVQNWGVVRILFFS